MTSSPFACAQIPLQNRRLRPGRSLFSGAINNGRRQRVFTPFLETGSQAPHIRLIAAGNCADTLTATSLGLPSVRVPVLTTARVSIFRMTFDGLGISEQDPHGGPLPVPLSIATKIDMRVAKPRPQGQAIMSTATALIKACAIFGSWPYEKRRGQFL
jgi:hypothetical protein